MTIRAQLEQICQATPGARACALMGFDGFAIDSVEVGQGAGVDVPTLLSGYAEAVRGLRAAAQAQPQAGGLEELVVMTAALVAVIRPLNDDFYVAVVLAPTGTWGKARLLLRLGAAELLAALA